MIATLTKGSGGTFQVSARRYTDPGSPVLQYCANLGLRQDDVNGRTYWKYGTPPSNGNFAWMQHMIHHLAPTRSMALLLANGSMSTNTGWEGEISRALVEAYVVECIVVLPGQFVKNAAFPACLWFPTKKNKGHRAGQILFIDARKMGSMKDRVLRDFTAEDIAQVADTFHRWQSPSPVSPEIEERAYEDVPGFCKSATLEEVKLRDFVLSPGRYVGADEGEAGGEQFSARLLRAAACSHFQQEAALEQGIQAALAELGVRIDQ